MQDSAGCSKMTKETLELRTTELLAMINEKDPEKRKSDAELVKLVVDKIISLDLRIRIGGVGCTSQIHIIQACWQYSGLWKLLKDESEQSELLQEIIEYAKNENEMTKMVKSSITICSTSSHSEKNDGPNLLEMFRLFREQQSVRK